MKKDLLYLRRGWEKIDKYLRTSHWFLYVLYDIPSNEDQFVHWGRIYILQSVQFSSFRFYVFKIYSPLSPFVSLISILFSLCCVSIILTVFHSLRPSASLSLPSSLSFTIKQVLAPLFYFTSLTLLSIARKTLYLYHTPKTLRVLKVRTSHIQLSIMMKIVKAD